MGWVNKSDWTTKGSHPPLRYKGKEQVGTGGDFVTPNAYRAIHGRFDAPKFVVGYLNPVPFIDVPNLQMAIYQYTGPGAFPYARNKSWSSLVNQVRPNQAELGVLLGEMRESSRMIATRCTQMYHAYRALRRGNFRGFLRELHIGPYRRHRNWVRNSVADASGLWLEYSFGWAPLASDVSNACGVLGQETPHRSKVSGSGRQRYAYETNIEEMYGLAYVKQGCLFRVVNPNAYLAQSLGVTNWASIAWELIPFSFMVDWAFDVGSFLGSFTDLMGLEITGAYNTLYVEASGTVRLYRNDWTPPYESSGKACVIKRSSGLTTPLPNTQAVANIGQSVKRAANAASLLGQILAS